MFLSSSFLGPPSPPPSADVIYGSPLTEKQTAPLSLLHHRLRRRRLSFSFSSLCPAFPFIALQYFPSPFYPSDPVTMFAHTPPPLPFPPSFLLSLSISALSPLATSPFSPFPPSPPSSLWSLPSRQVEISYIVQNRRNNNIRGRPYMTSAKFSVFWIPSPLVRIWD